MTVVSASPYADAIAAVADRAPTPRSARRPVLGKVTQVAADAAALALAAWVAVAACDADITATGDAPGHRVLGLLAVPLGLLVLARLRLYNARAVAFRLDELRGTTHACALLAMILVAAGRVMNVEVSLVWLLAFAALSFLFVSVDRELTRSYFKRQRASGLRRRPTMVIGGNEEATALAATLDLLPELGYQVVGLCTVEPHDGPWQHLGGVEDFAAVISASGATTAVLATSAFDGSTANRLVRDLHDCGVHVELSSGLVGIAPERLTVRSLGPHSVFYLEPTVHTGWRAWAKRTFDATGAALALVAASPILALAAVAIKLTSPGPVLFRQERVGKDGVPFGVLKLRTMVVDAEARLADLLHKNEADGPLFKIKDDPRITTVGRLLRKLSIDEAPQLWNVLKGQMSLVGPRPALPSEVAEWDVQVRNRLRVKPGITGMWQVSGRSDASFDSYVRLDLYYVDNWTLITDLAILAKTVPTVLFSKGAY